MTALNQELIELLSLLYLEIKRRVFELQNHGLLGHPNIPDRTRVAISPLELWRIKLQ